MRKRISALLCALSLLIPLTACGPKVEETATTIFAMDTVMNLTLLHDGPKEEAEAALSGEVARIYDFEGIFSATAEGSDVHKINAAGGKKVEVSPETADLLGQALALCDHTGGVLDVTAYPAVKAWGFTTGNYRVVPELERSALAARIGYERVVLEDGFVTLQEGMELDLGAVAKG